MEIVKFRVWVSGRVQGVGFRQSVKNEANKKNITGWVRNLSDGSVEILAQGTRRDVEAFVVWCKAGPGLARIDSIKTKQEKTSGPLNGFEVKEFFEGWLYAAKNLMK